MGTREERAQTVLQGTSDRLRTCHASIEATDRLLSYTLASIAHSRHLLDEAIVAERLNIVGKSPRENRISITEQHIAEQRAAIFRQHARIGHLREMGVPTEFGENLLARMNEHLESLITHLDRISR